jgi:hypothetical protein
MQEALLHFIWKHRLLCRGDWRTADGQMLRVFNTGVHNPHAGPDFTEALLGIGSERWMGQVEMHVNPRDWMLHGHQHDPAYNNVILHVVWEGNEPVFRLDGTLVPVFELKKWVPAEMLARYARLYQKKTGIPCSGLKHDDLLPYYHAMFDRAGVERLEHRVYQMECDLKLFQGDWEQSFWYWMAGAFGLKVNREPMQQLARQTSVHLLHKLHHRLEWLEALLLGQAGFLHASHVDDYPRYLHEEYQYLRQKFRLTPLHGLQWKFLRMRPAGFPTLRLAQMAALMHQSMPFFQRMRQVDEINELLTVLQPEPASYWQNHFRPDDGGHQGSGQPGVATRRLWVINALLPAFFLYGRQYAESGMESKAIAWLEALPAESNQVIRGFEKMQLKPVNALQSQGIIELYKHYCHEHRCLTCMVGNKLLTFEPNEHGKTG